MYKHFLRIALAGLLCFGLGTAVKADDYTIDAVHSGVSFQILHLGLSNVHGRFNDFGGSFTIDTSDPSRSAFSLSIKTDSVDTNNTGRDGHLKSPDFFNVKQFPTIGFKSTSVKPIDGGYEVTGDLTIHGATKSGHFFAQGRQNGRVSPRESPGPAFRHPSSWSSDPISGWASRCPCWVTRSMSRSALKGRKSKNT